MIMTDEGTAYLMMIRDILYEKSWGRMRSDLQDRMMARGFMFKWPMPKGAGVEETLEFLEMESRVESIIKRR